MSRPLSLNSDFLTLFLAATDRELDEVSSAVRRVAPGAPASQRADEAPVALAALVEAAVNPHAAGFDEPQADLAAAALTRAGRPVPEHATVPELEADVLSHVAPITARDALQDLAVTIARLRRRKLERLAAAGMEIAAEPLTRRSETSAISAIVDAVKGNVVGSTLLDALQQAVDEARKMLGRVNILVAGRTGVGKSTLINAVFGDDVATVGVGAPVTQAVAWFEPPGLPVRLCDTKGLEMESFAATLDELAREIGRANGTGRAEDRIHVLWLCIDEPSARLQPGEQRIAELCGRHGIPALVVLTKAIGPRDFATKIRDLMPQARDVVRVLADDWDDRPAFGLNDLIEATDALLPEAARTAFDAAQQVDIARKRRRALQIARSAAMSAAGAAAVPIPIANAGGVFAINAGMIARIAATMGVRMTQGNLLPLGASLLGALAAASGGRLIAGQLLQLIPGIGSISGGVINGSVALSTTYGLGYGFTEFLCRYHAAQGRMPEGDELQVAFRKFWQTWREKEKPPPGPEAQS